MRIGPTAFAFWIECIEQDLTRARLDRLKRRITRYHPKGVLNDLQDFYRRLEVEPGARLADMKRSYRDLVMGWHPCAKVFFLNSLLLLKWRPAPNFTGDDHSRSHN